MGTPRTAFRRVLLFLAVGVVQAGAAAPEIPEPLRPWQDWATWEATYRDCPTPYHTADQPICFWPASLMMKADPDGGSWELGVTVYAETWVPLPGDEKMWPLQVQANDAPVVVVEREGRPSVRLSPGTHQLTGTFAWTEMPQQVAVPGEVGVLSLALDGNPVEIPNWDASGRLWLRRQRVEATAEDQLSVEVYRLIEDGIPLWLRTEVELRVSGKSREEDLGWVLPAGWTLATVDSPIPVAVEADGRMKVQVRAGAWRVALHAFRTTDPGEIGFAESAVPVIDRELVGFRARPDFRMAELEGLRATDVTQTTYPEKWRGFPVYAWSTDTRFQLVEKMRGMGLREPQGMVISRALWLDEDGSGMTFRDTIQGQMQQVWRLDIADGQDLGAVRVDGTGQLITANPRTGAHGVELRTRSLDLQAIGRMDRVTGFSATGWQTDADSLRMTLHLPPGWRVLALFGADWVRGDWLTAWSLLDLFLLLIFALAVFRLWGWPAGAIAFLAFGLAYHEPGAPRFAWLFLLMPLALLRVVTTSGTGRRWVVAWRFLAVVLLVLLLVPFVASQLQSVIYPQLESQGLTYQPPAWFGFGRVSRGMGASLGGTDQAAAPPVPSPRAPAAEMAARGAVQLHGGVMVAEAQARFSSGNLTYEPKARIQTGPAEPVWTWNRVECGWNGPVASEEQIRPVFISLALRRVLTLARVILLVLLAGILLGARWILNPLSRRSAAAALVALSVFGQPGPARAELPDAQTLQTLRERLLEPADAYPHGAAIPEAILTVNEGRLIMEVEIHCAVRAAVPLPGGLPAWSPLSVTADGGSGLPLRRRDGFLWVVLDEGVHRVRVSGQLPPVTEWAWTFQLQPKRVRIDAPGWNVTGVQPGGVPDRQVFFARQRAITEEEAAYDRKDFQVVAAVDRHLEIGLTWRVRSEVSRLSLPGKAVSFRVPLLPGEKVLTPDVVVEDGAIEVRLGAEARTWGWVSELPVGETIRLSAAETERWVERWHLVTSPVWNAALSGIDPVFEPQEQALVPVWSPWPGESVTLSFSKPEAVTGETMTLRQVRHETTLGGRQRTGRMVFEVECSLGEDFTVDLDPAAEITLLNRDGQAIPVRRNGGTLVIPVQPGKQTLEVEWRTDERMAMVARAGAVSLPVEAANISTAIRVPQSRWVLWVSGPRRGPAVRFWTILAVAVLAAGVLGSLRLSPIGRLQWVLLGLGLTQVPLVPALMVVSWFFLLGWRGKPERGGLRPWRFDLLQLLLVFWSAVSLVVLIVAVGQGLLGNPDMFIRGNGSSHSLLQWFAPSAAAALPRPTVVSVSVWFYRLLMLAWALWLATALLGWLKWGWAQFSRQGCWKRLRRKKAPSPPRLPEPA